MKNKGFTLVEVMAIVIIIAAIALVSFPVLTNVVKNNEKIEEDTFKESAIEAAKTYCNLNKSYDEEGKCSVTISKLIEESYLDTPTIKDYDYKQAVVDCKDSCTYFKSRTYSIGDEIILSGEKYYVIENSDESLDYVTLLKDKLLTVDEIQNYGMDGNGGSYINLYSNPASRHQAINLGDDNNSGAVAYYSATYCTYNRRDHIPLRVSGCRDTYRDSHVRKIVDAWAEDKFKNNELKTVDYNNNYFKIVEHYSARLITIEEIEKIVSSECIFDSKEQCLTGFQDPDWLFLDYYYWIMSDSYRSAFIVTNSAVNTRYPFMTNAVRPVINVYKSALENNS